MVVGIGDDLLESPSCLLQVGRSEVGVIGDSAIGAQFGQDALEFLLVGPQHDLAEGLHETAVRIPGEVLVIGPLGEGSDHVVVDPKIEDRVHHARHREPRTRTYRQQERWTIGGAETTGRGRFETPAGGAYFVP